MARKRRAFSAAFKAKVALDAIKGLKTSAEIAKAHSVHVTQIALWKKQLLDDAPSIFEASSPKAEKLDTPSDEELYAEIGRLKVQLDWLKKKWPKTVAEKRSWIDFDDCQVSVREQCELLGLHRSNVYYEPRFESPENLEIMRIIDKEHLCHPAKGRRQMTDFLRRQGYAINPKRTRRLMEIMGIEAIAPKPRTTVFAKGHKVYPYLLRNLVVDRPDQVWCSDITYIPTSHGYLYLCAVMDWHSRFVLSWKLSNSMDDLCTRGS